MPNALNRRTGSQWEICDRCGFQFPIGQLVRQKGLLVCTRTCFDDLTVERRPYMIEQILGTAVDQEGVDLRVIDRGFFDLGSDEGVS